MEIDACRCAESFAACIERIFISLAIVFDHIEGNAKLIDTLGDNTHGALVPSHDGASILQEHGERRSGGQSHLEALSHPCL